MGTKPFSPAGGRERVAAIRPTTDGNKRGAAGAAPSQNGDEEDEPDKKRLKPQDNAEQHDSEEMDEDVK